ncbi:hypothetical protein HYT23_03145 [Candidatus Pacearchaeota archaeon]|nr:hypothetical protein [Candidatus Pacearchaeota archaeon]
MNEILDLTKENLKLIDFSRGRIIKGQKNEELIIVTEPGLVRSVKEGGMYSFMTFRGNDSTSFSILEQKLMVFDDGRVNYLGSIKKDYHYSSVEDRK